MSSLTNDELTVLGIAALDQHVAPIGRWKPSVLSLTLAGLMRRVDDVNYVITEQGRKEHAQNEDEPYRQILESGNKIANARTQAQQSIEQAALHLSFAAKASALVTGETPEDAAMKWSREVLIRALEMLKNG